MSSSLERRPRPVYPSDLARSARRREQREQAKVKAREVNDRQQVARDLANELEALARRKIYVDFADLLNSLALRVRSRGNSTPDRESDSVLKAITIHHARTFIEIVEDTAMLKADVRRTLDALVSTGLIKEIFKQYAPTQYWPTGTSCGDVLP